MKRVMRIFIFASIIICITTYPAEGSPSKTPQKSPTRDHLRNRDGFFEGAARLLFNYFYTKIQDWNAAKFKKEISAATTPAQIAELGKGLKENAVVTEEERAELQNQLVAQKAAVGRESSESDILDGSAAGHSVDRFTMIDYDHESLHQDHANPGCVQCYLELYDRDEECQNVNVQLAKELESLKFEHEILKIDNNRLNQLLESYKRENNILNEIIRKSQASID